MNEIENQFITEVRNRIIQKQFKVDIFLSGSSSRNEERYHNSVKVSDLDIVFVIKSVDDRKHIKEALTDIEAKFGDSVNASKIFCMFENFTHSLLADYYLNIKLEEPILKKLDTKYSDFKDEPLNSKRWLYQMQSTVFYYCKFKVSNNNIFICKSFQCLLRVYAYINRICKTNKYILLKELPQYIPAELKKLLLESTKCVIDSLAIDDITINQIRTYVESGIVEVLKSDNINNSTDILESLKVFSSFWKEKGNLDYTKADYYSVMKAVLAENLGFNDISIIDYD